MKGHWLERVRLFDWIKKIFKKNDWNKEIKVRKLIAVFLLLLFLIPVLLVLPYCFSITTKMMILPEKRSFIIPIYINHNGTSGFVESDIEFSLNFSYPKETLIIDERVEIIGLSVLKGNVADNITRILLTFQNCMEYGKFDQWGMPKQAFLHFVNINGSRGLAIDEEGRPVYLLSDDITANWFMDGDYKPVIGVFYDNNTNSTMVIDDVVIHVYPKEQLTQIETNKASVILSFTVLILSIVGVITLFYYLWDYDSQKK